MIKNNWYPVVKQKKNWQREFADKQDSSIAETIWKYKKKLGYRWPWQ